jgi:hypothetical protein
MPNSLARGVTVFTVTALLFAAFASRSAQRTMPMTIHGVVAGTYFTPPAGSTPSETAASHYSGARVCADTNDNVVCDFGEASTTTDASGAFQLHSQSTGPVIVEISTASLNGGNPVGQRVVLRAAYGQIAEGQGNAGHAKVQTPAESNITITPLSTEVVRIMEADNVDYQTAKWRLATRLNVPMDELLSDPGTLSDGAAKTALLTESVILTSRFGLAAKMADRGDATMKDAQQAVMNLESIPRYDNIFIIMLENKATSSIKNSAFAPKINAYLNANNQFTSYFATGNPSEPNRDAVGAADDFGVTDDNAWNCVPSGDKADLPEDPLPTGLGTCTNATNHNFKNKANLFNAMTNGGMTWRIYSESMNAGRDWRLNGTADSTLVAPDHVYPAGTSPISTSTTLGNPNLMLTFPSGLYATKHNATISFQNVRSAPEFFSSNRTMGGGQWDDAIRNSPSTPAGWDIDQLGTDLASGDVGNLNYLEPDQCDDMHGVTVTGKITGTTTTGTASDCGGNANIYRGDNYTDYLIRKIQASPIWTNTQKRVAIVIMFDEGTATTGFNSCCGWNPSAGSSIAGKSLGVLTKNPNGTVSVDTTIARYNQGNKGHGTSIFGLITNQPSAPKGVVDSDAYSHISLVRTLQDMFELADPGDAWSYMNRSKYTEPFIAANILNLPEYALSADPHFDAVRPMNHAFQIPAEYVQKSGFLIPPGTPQVGPDANQINPWALK